MKKIGYIKEIFNSKFFDCFLDFLLIISLLLQDIYKLTLFGTPFYKYIILFMFFLLICDYFFNDRKFKVSIYYLLILVIIYCYTFILSFNINIIVPSVFFIVQSLTFLLYIQRFKNKKQLEKSFFRIILYSSIILSVFGLIQYFSFKFNIEFIYKNLTQFVFYLKEGRLTSIYSEPAHLCTILSAGVFVSLYRLVSGKSNLYYLPLVLNLIVILLSDSIVTYIAIFIFICLFYLFIIIDRKTYFKRKCRIFSISCVILFFVIVNFILLMNNGTLSVMVDKVNSIFNSNYGVVEDNNTSDLEIEDSSNESNNTDSSGNGVGINQNELKPSDYNDAIYQQASSSSGFALKSNLNIGMLKLKDGYIFGTGVFTHMNYYDHYMERLYPDGYIRINYTDACSMFLRIFSEFGIIGLILFVFLLLVEFVRGIYRKDIFSLFMLSIFVTQCMRLGEYNWVLNCFPFIYLIYNSFIYSKKVYILNNNKR